MSQKIEIRSVQSEKDLEQFIRFPFQLYKDNPYWVPPQIKEEKAFFDPKANPVFQKAEACCFLAYQNNKIVGRVAALLNHIEKQQMNAKKLRFGWLDFIDNLAVSKALLEAIEAWGKDRKLEHIEGPMGFSNLDKAGMLIEGFQEKSTMITLYNHSYYSTHLEQLGFSKQKEWVEYEIKIPTREEAPEKVKHFAGLILKRYALKIVHFKAKKNIFPYVDQMFKLLDQTYSSLSTYIPIQPYQVEHYKKKYFPYINPDFIKCIINREGELIAFSIILPCFSSALQKMKGKSNWLSYFHLVKAMYFNDRASFYLIGIRPDFQNKGITALIFNEMLHVFHKHNMQWVETNPELKDNLAIQQLWKHYQKRLHKRRVTYGKNIT
ncbi:MAG: GTP cyclohydrolase [Flavobacteriaceae bacterium]